ncbi:hypothetical protein [Sorangium sp. So ce233]|uniref:hypothetical protein n=1 Tax=Sorangium sp. So ce233 TaxID=3133290 RepID=UPI003F637371
MQATPHVHSLDERFDVHRSESIERRPVQLVAFMEQRAAIGSAEDRHISPSLASDTAERSRCSPSEHRDRASRRHGRQSNISPHGISGDINEMRWMSLDLCF